MIPRQFHAFWGGPPMPAQFHEFLVAWVELHGWPLHLWTEHEVQEVLAGSRHLDLFERPQHWSPRSNPWQWRADIARYEILHRQGGVWVDCDLEPLRPIDPILEEAERHANGGAFAAREDDRWVCNAFVGAAPGHPLLHDAIYSLENRIRTNRQLRVNRSIGPHFLTWLVARHPETVILPRELVYPFSYRELEKREDDFPAAFTKHHWHNRTSASTRVAPRRRGR